MKYTVEYNNKSVAVTFIDDRKQSENNQKIMFLMQYTIRYVLWNGILL